MSFDNLKLLIGIRIAILGLMSLRRNAQSEKPLDVR